MLARVEPDEVAVALHGLLNGGKMYSLSIQAENPLDEYRMALSGLSKEGLRRAYTKLKRGEYPDCNSDFIPIPSKLAELVRNEQQHVVEDLARLRATYEALEISRARSADPDKGTSRDPEAVARVRAMRKAFLRNHAAEKEKAMNPVPRMPTSPERAEMLAKIKDLPDAPNITAEQMANRRKCQAELAAFEVEEKRQADMEERRRS